MVSSKTEVKNFMLTSDLITAQSLGLVRIEGNPRFFNGENLGEVCVEINAYVTKEDLKKFKPKEVRLQNHCFTDQNIPLKDIKEKARESAFLEIIKKHNPSLSNISKEEARKLIHEFNPIKENFDFNTGAYCMDVTAKIIPFELEFYKKGGGIKKTGKKTAVVTFKKEDLISIPPDILRQMDPDIVTDRRPKIVTIEQKDIFGLRDKPRMNADLVRFDFNPSTLSTTQRRILDAWMRAGHHKIYLLDSDIPRYATLFALNAIGRPKFNYPRSAKRKFKQWRLVEHPVSTDCEHLDVGTYNGGRRVSQYYFKDMAPAPESLTPFVVDETDRRVLCGAFSFGRATVYFRNTVSGPDHRRWYLNFMHFALDLPVPGAG
jgi:hypothetical protein